MSQSVTIRTVAEHAGVSYQTVSRVINGNHAVAPGTRERVLESIEALHYRPNAAARSLAQNRTFTLGLVIPYDPDLLFADPQHLEMIHAIDRETTLHDYSVLLCTPRAEDNLLSAHRRLLRGRLVDGVIVSGERGADGARLLVDNGYPVVMVGYNAYDIPSVRSDDEGSGYDAIQYLLSLGHRQVGVITGPAEAALGRSTFLRGCERAFREFGRAIDSAMVVAGDYTSASGYSAAAKLVQQSQAPTAIFALNDRMAMGAIHWLHEHGYAVPNDVSVVGHDDIRDAQLFAPPLTTIQQPIHEIGKQAVALLFRLLEDKQPVTTETIIASQLIVRASSGAPK